MVSTCLQIWEGMIVNVLTDLGRIMVGRDANGRMCCGSEVDKTDSHVGRGGGSECPAPETQELCLIIHLHFM